jgi:DHA3 family tetracycline resistance protein-like MFS transporter
MGTALLRPSTVYLIHVAVTAFASTLAFTANLVFQVDDAALSPLELVLVGTVWEATYFVFEVPTGVVADVFGRRVSVITGLLISSAGLGMIAASPEFATIAAGFVVNGIGGTFVSGAQDAWVADEGGAENAGATFLRGSQWTRGATLLAIPLSAGLGSIDIRLPQFAGAVLTAGLALFLLAAMRETAFRPPSRAERAGFGAMFATLGESRALVRRRPVLLTVLAVAAVFGAASEGFDRLYTPHLLREVGLPAWRDLDPIVWVAGISAVQTAIALGVIQYVRGRLDTTDHASLTRALQLSDALRIGSVVAFAFTVSFGPAMATYLPARAFATLHYPLYNAWINLSLESRVRATMLSVSGQSDSLGQVLGGPAVGLLAEAVSVRAGLVVAGLMLAPVLPLYRRALGQGGGETVAAGADAVS